MKPNLRNTASACSEPEVLEEPPGRLRLRRIGQQRHRIGNARPLLRAAPPRRFSPSWKRPHRVLYTMPASTLPLSTAASAARTLSIGTTFGSRADHSFRRRRYSRGIDPAGTAWGLPRATRLIFGPARSCGEFTSAPPLRRHHNARELDKRLRRVPLAINPPSSRACILASSAEKKRSARPGPDLHCQRVLEAARFKTTLSPVLFSYPAGNFFEAIGQAGRCKYNHCGAAVARLLAAPPRRTRPKDQEQDWHGCQSGFKAKSHQRGQFDMPSAPRKVLPTIRSWERILAGLLLLKTFSPAFSLLTVVAGHP